jgi:Tfp pilus assembly protein PilF
MSQVKIRSAKKLHVLERYIFYIACVLFVALFAYAAFYIYTGKGWLLLERKETVSDFYYTRGLYYFGKGAYDLPVARLNFEKALANANGHYESAYLEIARTYFVEGDFSSALIEANAELANYPSNNRAHYVEGLIYGFRKQYIQAEEQFKIYIANEPYPAWAPYNDLSWIYFSEGNYADAAQTAWQGMQHTIEAPFSAWLENSYAVSEMNMGKYAEAEKYFLLAQKDFAAMTPAQWGISYSGNSPAQYGEGLAQARAAIVQNLALVHSKLHDY